MNDEMIYAVYGKSGFGREVMPLVADNTENDIGAIKVFIDDAGANEPVNGYAVWTFTQLSLREGAKTQIIIAVADGKIRQKLSDKCVAAGVKFMSVKSSLHTRMDDCIVGEGAIFSPYTTLTSNIQIGKHFQCNIYSYIAHDCIVGDFVTFAPAVKCNGNVHVGDHAYIGTGAILKQGTPDNPLRIGAGAIVGMGAVVTKDVAPGAVVVGNPARPLEK